MATRKADQPKAKFEVLKPLEHDGERIEIGGIVDLTEAEAKPLFEQGVVAPTFTAPESN